MRAEAAALFPAGGAAAVPSREAVDGMEYCLAVLKEALRKYSVVPVVTRNLNAVSRGGVPAQAAWAAPRRGALSASGRVGNLVGRRQRWRLVYMQRVPAEARLSLCLPLGPSTSRALPFPLPCLVTLSVPAPGRTMSCWGTVSRAAPG